MDESAEPAGRPDPAPAGLERLESLEQQVRQLTSRLAGWVEAQLVQALEDRRSEMKALRSELQAIVNEQLSGLRAESASVLSVATRRFEVAHEQLGERLDAVAERAATASASAMALAGSTSGEAERVEILEQLVEQRLGGLADQVEARLAASTERHRAELQVLSATAEGLEQRLRSAMSRLSESVEGRLAEVATARDSEIDGVRADVARTIDERVAQAGSKAAMTLAVTQARLTEVDSRTTDRLEEMARQIAVATDGVASLLAEAEAGTARVDAFEQRVKSAMGRLTDSVETRLAEVAAGRSSELDGVGARLEAVAREAAAAAAGAARSEATIRSAIERTDALEQQVKSAIGRLSDSVDSRLADAGSARKDELHVVTERLDDLARVAAANAERLVALQGDVGGATERTDALEQRVKAAMGRLSESVEGRLKALETDDRAGGDLLERHRDGLEALRTELAEDLAKQLGEARADIGATVDNAHRRFLLSVEELQDRLTATAEQAGAATSAVELLQETVGSDGRRIESLELHTRRTDDRLTDLVEAKLVELAAERATALDAVRLEQRAALDDHLAEQQRALDAHLAQTRVEVAATLGEGRDELAAGAARLEERQAGLDRRAADAVASLEGLSTSVEAALQEAEERLGAQVDAKLAGLEGLATQAVEARTDMAASVASVNRKVARVQDQAQRKVAALAEQVEALAAATAKSKAAEAGALAPLRSDVRMLQAQVAELGQTVAELHPRRKAAPAPAVKSPARALAASKAAKAAAPAAKSTKAVKAATAPVPATTAKAAKVAKAAKATKTAAAARRRSASQ